MNESEIEKYLVKLVEKELVDGKAVKFNSKNNRSWPDRLCTGAEAIIFFVECKKPGKEPTEKQFKKINYLSGCGFYTHVCDSKRMARVIVTMHKERQDLRLAATEEAKNELRDSKVIETG